MKIYLDVCCLCRPFDDQTSYRIRMEAEAIIVILNRCLADWDLVGSEVIEYEIGQMADEERKNAARHFLACNRKMVKITENIVKRARIFHEMGVDTFDALHLASA